MVRLDERLVSAVEAEPGIHLRGLMRALGVSGSAVTAALERLVAEGRVHAIQMGGRKLFYCEPPSEDAAWLRLHQKAELILASSGETLVEISEDTGLPRSTVQYYVAMMKQRGIW